MTEAPSVSVLVTTYNHAAYVREALDSLRQQTCQDFETIVTDDASTDGTPEIIAAWLAETGFPARFIANPFNRGICANRNTALALARGRFVCSLAGDDVYLPDRIARQLGQFETLAEDVAGLANDVEMIDEAGRPIAPSYFRSKLGDGHLPGDIFAHLLTTQNFIPAPGVMLRRSAIAAVGGYDETLIFEDLDMWLKLAHRFRLQLARETVLRYRVLPESLSHSVRMRPRMMTAEFQLLSKWIGRCPSLETELADRMWRIACRALLLGHSAAAETMMAKIAATSSSWRRRILARMVLLTSFGAICTLAAQLKTRLSAWYWREKTPPSSARRGFAS